MAAVLIVTWDGAGNLVPFQALAQELVRRGHEVTVLSHASSRTSFEQYGCRFVPYTSAIDYDAADRSGGTEDEHQAFVMNHVWKSQEIAVDTAQTVARLGPAAVVVDSALYYAHAAVEASKVPALGLHHNLAVDERFRKGVEMLMTEVLAGLNDYRRSLRLEPIESIHDSLATAAGSIAATAPTLDRASGQSTIIQVGPIRPTAPAREFELPPGTEPLVVVGLSSGWMHQVEVLQLVLDAAAPLAVRVLLTLGRSVDPDELTVPANATIARWVPHEQVLPHASLLITHAGLGTLNVGLSHGTPMICIPMGRDQPFNASLAESLGVAVKLASSATVDELRGAIETALADEEMRSTCRMLGQRMRAETRLDLAVTAVEDLLRLPS